MSGGARAAIPQRLVRCPHRVIYPPWASALSQASARPWAASAADDHWLTLSNTSVNRSFRLVHAFHTTPLVREPCKMWRCVTASRRHLIIGAEADRGKEENTGWWETVREDGKEKGHASDMHHCSLHARLFIKIIKPSGVLKVKSTINLTGRQKEEPQHRHCQANKQSKHVVMSLSTGLSVLNPSAGVNYLPLKSDTAINFIITLKNLS